MADLGKILLMPKGEYDSSTTYELLDVVKFNRNSYVCKVTSSVGIDPTDTTNWMLMVEHGTDSYGYGHIEYSEYADGTNHVSTPTATTVYIGFYMGNEVTPPADKTAYTWSKYVGKDGVDGTGNSWTTGTIFSGQGSKLTGVSGIVGDLYLNTSTNDVYQCTKAGTSSTAEWSWISNIKGASGSGTGDMLSTTYAPTAIGQGLSNVVDTALTLNGLTPSIAELNYIDGVTSSVQTQLDNKATTTDLAKKISEPSSDGTAGQALVTDGNGNRSWATVASSNYISSVDTNSFTVDSNSKLSLSNTVSAKLSKLPSDNGTSGQVMTSNGDGTSSWEDAPSGGHEMLKTVADVEAITSASDEHVASAYVIKNYSNRYTDSVIGTLTASDNEVTLTDDLFKNDDATFEFMFEPTLNASSEYEYLTLSAYEIDTDNGTVKLTVVTAPTVDTRVRVDVTSYRA